jgi:4-hydroxy-3-methylbut-2-en-1-yl diphosphate reductase
MAEHPDTPTPLVVAAPLRIEALALRGAVGGGRLVRTGMGPRRSAASAGALDAAGRALAVAGVCAGLDPALRPGDVVVASEVRGPHGTVACDGAERLMEALRRRGLRPRLGPLVSVDHIVQGEERARLRAGGAIAADMESAFLAAAVPERRRFAVLRVVSDSPERELKRPGLVLDAARALRVLRRSAPALQEWSVGNATTMQAASRNAVIPKEVT